MEQQYTSANWIDRAVMYWCDEPQQGVNCPLWPSEVVTTAQVAHSGAGYLRQAVTTDRGTATDAIGATYYDYIDLITPNIISIQPPGTTGFPTSELNQYGQYLSPSAHRSLWWYQANDTAAYGNPSATEFSGYPQLGIDVDGAKNRAMPWLTYAMAPTRGGRGIAGELYYATTEAYGSTSEITGSMLYQHGQNGDCTLMYPGRNRPLPSLRLKILRDGMEDYEYLQMVAQTSVSGIECARSLARLLFGDARSVSSSSGPAIKSQRTVAAAIIKNPFYPCTIVDPW